MLEDGSAVYTPGLSETRGGTSAFYHPDAIGSTRDITNSSQSVTDTRRYDAFGMLMSTSGSNPTPFGFVGGSQYQTDGDSGLMLLGHRYYDASIGRFISRDPAYAGDNWYAYCGNGPLTTTDSTGLITISFGVGVVGQLLFWGGMADISLDVDTTGAWGISAHLGGGVGFGVGASIGPGVSFSTGNITPGLSASCVLVAFIGFDGVGGNGFVSGSPNGTGGINFAGGGSKWGPTEGVGFIEGGQIGYQIKGPGNWINGIRRMVNFVCSL